MKGSYVFSCFIDQKKSIDTINRQKLFEILLAKGIPRCFNCKVLCHMYFGQWVKVCWNNAVSYVFECSNGVRHGSSVLIFL